MTVLSSNLCQMWLQPAPLWSHQKMRVVEAVKQVRWLQGPATLSWPVLCLASCRHQGHTELILVVSLHPAGWGTGSPGWWVWPGHRRLLSSMLLQMPCSCFRKRIRWQSPVDHGIFYTCSNSVIFVTPSGFGITPEPEAAPPTPPQIRPGLSLGTSCLPAFNSETGIGESP